MKKKKVVQPFYKIFYNASKIVTKNPGVGCCAAICSCEEKMYTCEEYFENGIGVVRSNFSKLYRQDAKETNCHKETYWFEEYGETGEEAEVVLRRSLGLLFAYEYYKGEFLDENNKSNSVVC